MSKAIRFAVVGLVVGVPGAIVAIGARMANQNPQQLAELLGRMRVSAAADILARAGIAEAALAVAVVGAALFMASLVAFVTGRARASGLARGAAGTGHAIDTHSRDPVGDILASEQARQDWERQQVHHRERMKATRPHSGKVGTEATPAGRRSVLDSMTKRRTQRATEDA